MWTPRAKERNNMQKLISALTLAVFAFNCWFAWAMVTLTLDIRNAGRVLPFFANLCIALRPLMLALPVLVAAYCLRDWFRNAEKARTWPGCLAATLGVLILVVFPAMISSYLLLVDPVRLSFR
jgi:hypothetical protein